MEMVRGIVQSVHRYALRPRAQHPDTWDLATLRTDVLSQFGYKIDPAELAGMSRDEMEEFIFERLCRSTRKRKTWSAPTSCARPSAWSCCR